MKKNCLAIVLIGCIFSLLGPCFYTVDYGRDLYLLRQIVIHKDYSCIMHGIQASGNDILSNTLSGFYYLVMLPFTYISISPQWLYFVTNLLIVISFIPFWYLIKKLTNGDTAWIATAIFSISSSRIIAGNFGLHCFLALLPGICFHLVLINYIKTLKIKYLIWLAILLFICLSFHLSFLPIIIVAPIILLGYYWEIVVNYINNKKKYIKFIILATFGLCFITFIYIIRKNLSLQNLIIRLKATFFTIYEQIGLVNSGPLEGIIHKNQLWLTIESVLGIFFLLIAISGVLFLLRKNKTLKLFKGQNEKSNTRLLRIWLFSTIFFSTTAAFFSVTIWYTKLNLFLSYRYLVPAVPAFILLSALGLKSLSEYLQPRCEKCNIKTVLIICFLAFHVFSLLPFYLNLPWRFDKHSVLPNLSNGIEIAKNKWGFSYDWLAKRIFFDPEIEYHSRNSGSVLNYLVVSNKDFPPSRFLGNKAILVSKKRSKLNSQKASFLDIQDSFSINDIEISLFTLSSKAIGYMPHIYVFFLPDNFLITDINKNFEVNNKFYPLIALTSKPPKDIYSEHYIDVIIEKDGNNIKLGSALYYSKIDDNDKIDTPYVRIITKKEVYQMNIPFIQIQKLKVDQFYTQRKDTILDNISVSDILDVKCGFKSYIDSSHYKYSKEVEWSIYK